MIWGDEWKRHRFCRLDDLDVGWVQYSRPDIVKYAKTSYMCLLGACGRRAAGRLVGERCPQASQTAKVLRVACSCCLSVFASIACLSHIDDALVAWSRWCFVCDVSQPEAFLRVSPITFITIRYVWLAAPKDPSR